MHIFSLTNFGNFIYKSMGLCYNTDMINYEEVYGREASAMLARKNTLETLFVSRYKTAPTVYVSSCGRAEIVGNHTDHNLGKVIVGAISCDILAAVSLRTDGIVEIGAEDFRTIRFHVSDLKRRESEARKSSALARGVCRYLADRKYPLGGFSAVTHSTVFRGAGVSSSAAFEVLIAEIVNVLYAGGKIPPLVKAEAGKFAENVYFGKPCGLLDQTGIAFGGLNAVDFYGASAPRVKSLSMPEGYALALVNTGGSHASLTKHYASISKEMSEVAAYFHKKYLREVEKTAFEESIPALRKKVSDRAILRASHFFAENERVDRAADALARGDRRAFFKQVRSSGASSLTYLQNGYVAGEVSQPLLIGVITAARLIKEGAFRIMGGGFTGTVLAILPERETAEYAAETGRIFGRENVHVARLRPFGACEISFD